MKNILNIFTKQPIQKRQKHKAKNKEKPKITIDYREKNSLTYSYLYNNPEIEIKTQQLNIADYIIETKNKKNIIAIERKSSNDFINSIFNKRLFKQLIEIKKYPLHILIIEGSLKKRYEENNKLEKPVKGMILSIITKYKIPIIFTTNEKETSEYIYMLAKKQSKPAQQASIRPQKSNLSISEQKQFILEGFPSIGPTAAKKLLETFNYNLNEIFSANEQSLNKILNKSQIQNLKKLLK